MMWAGVYMGVGKAFIPPTIGEVIDGSAAQAGLETGDRVMFVDGLKLMISILCGPLSLSSAYCLRLTGLVCAHHKR